LLFNSFEFIFLFLPITLTLYFFFIRLKKMESAFCVLVLASLFFYGYWEYRYLALILFSMCFNFLCGQALSKHPSYQRSILIVGITINLALLGYFKYANFFAVNIGALFNLGWNLEKIFLPLAISFFTFQQISYLVDASKRETKEYNFIHYCLFVCFFPQLIAGPIVHHKEMLPQFVKVNRLTSQWENLAVGLGIFAVGLFKKTIIADNLSLFVQPVYDNPGIATELDFFMAWGSTLAYTFQLYFDFSGYSDMAIGCARMFGIKLPVNFFSPYKAENIVDFWRRWHITLSRFLRDYLYIPLGGNKKGPVRRYTNLLLTMLLGGLWHGAGWSFIVWGLLHGSYLIINHAWTKTLGILKITRSQSWLYRFTAWLITFLAVVISWVYFRAPTLEHANSILLAMAGFNGASLPAGVYARLGELSVLLQEMGLTVKQGGGAVLATNIIWVFVAGTVALLMPNTAQLFHRFEPVIYEHENSFRLQRSPSSWKWAFSRPYAVYTSILLLCGLLSLTQVSEFLYFQF